MFPVKNGEDKQQRQILRIQIIFFYQISAFVDNFHLLQEICSKGEFPF